ncbi:MAG TPA: sigma-70 family RNA polymerase sigma factor [Catalimonadaceae bacterium]|nr:sigma-70 family RNA polymerase sigma factor [Catalimonadaceae bacterium]
MNLSFSIQDKNLIEGLRSQDRKAQQWLFQKLNRKMFALCNRYIADPYQAEDVMMGGFMIVFSKTDQFSGEGNLEGWIRRIMVTQSLQFLRKSKTMEVVRYDGDEEVVEENSTAFTANLDYEVLLRLVQQLPMGYRMVFNLFAIEGYSHPEISEMLSISEGASKSQLFKARALLQTWVLDLQKTKLNQKN